MSSEYDEMIGALVSQHRDLPSLLTTIFSWLHRKSDFYVVDDSPKRPMGFRAGEAEKILLKSFREFPYRGPPAARSAAGAQKGGTLMQPQVTVRRSLDPPSTIDEKGFMASGNDSLVNSTGEARRGIVSSVRYTGDGKQIPVGSGGVGPGYWWEQTLSTVSLYVLLPMCVGSKSVECLVTGNKKLKLLIKGCTAPIIDQPLYASVTSDIVWNIETPDTIPIRRVDTQLGAHKPPQSCGLDEGNEGGGRLFSLFADKVVHTWWKSLTEGGPEIDAQMVDSTLPISAYDEDTQAAIRKAMYEQSQRAHEPPPFQ